MPVVLSIAGSDSGGGAGIQADLKTFQAFGCYGTTAITAITSQNTFGVSAIQGVEPEVVASQIHDVLCDFQVAAVKTGMLYSRDIIQNVIDSWIIEKTDSIPLVIDPVMISTSGHRLLDENAMVALRKLMVYADLITPNIPEASAFLQWDIASLKNMERAAKKLHEQTGAGVLLKGGHRFYTEEEREVVDVYYDGEEYHHFRSPLRDSRNTHGTGCTLSAAIASSLARGENMFQAIGSAKEYLDGAILHAPGFGNGESGPLNHLWRNP